MTSWGTVSDLRIDDIVAEFKTIGDAAFRNRYRDPVLLRRDSAGGESQAAFHTAFMSRDMLRDTNELHESDLAPSEGSEPGGEVVIVKKRAGGPFQERIGVGRARNADVHLPLPRVSKYHAYFTASDDRRQFFITDAGSKNGTLVDGAAIASRTPVPLQDGTEISIGPYLFLFYTPEGFHDLVSRRG